MQKIALERSHNTAAISDLTLDEIQVITGIRRCGKSTLLRTLINHLIKNTPSKSILYINFDDPNFTDICNDANQIRNIVTTAEKLTSQRINYLLLDEIQNVDSWEKYVKSAYDSRRFKKILVTGSNANLLNSHYTTLLSGRYIESRLYPMSYREILLRNNTTETLELIKNKPDALNMLDAMLTFGAFPRIYNLTKASDRRRILKNYYETILLKDCITNHNIRDTRTFINLAYYLINHVSNLYSYNSLSKALGSNENTIQQFIHILQNAYFMKELKQYSYSLKTQIHGKKKIYCIDNGLINTLHPTSQKN